MYRQLLGEMVKKNISIVSLAKEIGMSEKSLRNKINGITKFYWEETKAIRRIVAPEMSLEELFKEQKKAG